MHSNFTVKTVLAAALVLGAALPISAQGISEYPLPPGPGYPFGIVEGPDGAVWFAESYQVGRITTGLGGGTITEFPMASLGGAVGITVGPDGALWLALNLANTIGRMTTAGSFSEFPVPTADSGPYKITAGPDGNLWFTESYVSKIGRITPAGVVTEFPIPGGGAPNDIISGPDGNLWFTKAYPTEIGRITTAGVITGFPIPSGTGTPTGIAVGQDGALWFTEWGPNKIGRMTTAGSFLEFPIPTASSTPGGIAAGPDGAMWFTEQDGSKIGRITTGGVITEIGTPTAPGYPGFITTANDGGMYFTETTPRKIGRLFPLASTAFHPAALRLDTSGNHVLEPGEGIDVLPSWSNPTPSTSIVGGSATTFDGPSGPTYSIVGASGYYGPIDPGATIECGNVGPPVYQLSIDVPASRPSLHWDAVFRETVSTGDAKDWILHVGGSFADVPSSTGTYRFVETLLHKGVTAGCGSGNYCPGSNNSRAQMAVFLLVAANGSGYAPPPCTTPTFGDVPCSSGFAPWIDELAARGVTAGCGGGNYCPTDPVTRGQMAVFLLRTKEGNSYTPPPCVTPTFGDVPCSFGIAPWINELALRGITAGCGGGNYCPGNPVTRGQMAVFLTTTFGLTLYGP